jgi:hypothetical protein
MRPQVALPLLAAAISACVLALAGCGGGGGTSTTAAGSPVALIQQTFGSDQAVHSGRLTIAASADAEGTADFHAKVSARFDQARKGQLPRLDGTLDLTSSGGQLQAGAISTGTRGYLTVAGQAYRVPDAQFTAFTKRYLGDQQATQAARRPSLDALGIHPQRWLKDPREIGSRTIAGAPTIHLRADVDTAKLLADVKTLVARNGLGQQVSGADLDALRRSIRAARVDVDTGRDDHRLRRLAIALTLQAGHLDLSIQYDDLDRPQAILAPRDAKPLADLAAALGQLQGATGSGSSGSGTGSGRTPDAQRYADCLAQAGTDLAKVQACAKYL